MADHVASLAPCMNAVADVDGGIPEPPDAPDPATDTCVDSSAEPIDAIVISGGGIYGAMVLGALQYCIDKGIVDIAGGHIDMFAGTSIGSIICYLLVLGLFPTEIIHLLIRHRRHLESLASFNLVRMYNLEGGISFAGVQSVLERVTLDKTGTLFTLKSLHERSGKMLVCTAYNYTHKRIEYISWKTHPDMPCILAIQASCAIPVVFGRCVYGDSCYIDGAIHNNLPIDYVIMDGGKKRPLCFNIEFRHGTFRNDEKMHVYLYELYKIAVNAGGSSKCEIFKDRALIVHVRPRHNHPVWWNPDNITDLLDMFSDGYTDASSSTTLSENETADTTYLMAIG